jgi:hypothetical protein
MKKALPFLLLLFVSQVLCANDELMEYVLTKLFQAFGNGEEPKFNDIPGNLTGNVTGIDIIMAQGFSQAMLKRGYQYVDMLQNGFSANDLIADQTDLTELAMYSNTYIAYAVDRALKVIVLSQADNQERGIDFFNSLAKTLFKDNPFMSKYDIFRMNRLYDNLIAAFKKGAGL